MKINKIYIDVGPTNVHDVWDWELIKKMYRKSGVYVLKDTENTVLYVGKGGAGNKDKLGDRIEPHIRGWGTSYPSSKLGMQHFIRYIEVYEAGENDEAKHHASLIEAHFKLEYDPIFCKDSPSYSLKKYMDYTTNHIHRKWESWSKEDQDKLRNSKLL